MRLATTTLTAVATATALAATSTLSPVATAEETAPVPVVESGYVTWPFKSTFLNYIQGRIAKGTVDVSDGLEPVKDDKGKITTFNLPINADETSINADGVGTIDLKGAAHFLGHKGHGVNGGYGLDVKLWDFKVKLTEKEAIFTVDYLSKGVDTDGTPFEDRTGDDIEFAKLPLKTPIKPVVNETVKAKTEEGRLTTGAYTAMMDFYSDEYKPEADPASFEIKFGEPVKPEDPKEPEQPGTPEDPKEPEQPGTPEDPKEPEQPGTPEDPKEPEQPGNPEDPKEPEQPGNPDTPKDPKDPKDPAGSSLSTGGIIGIIVALLALIGGGAFFAHQAGFLK